jgi:hypothetical protein
VDIGRSISFIFEDRSWIAKILIMAVLFIIPIIGWLLIGGYLLRLLTNVINGQSDPLPEWNNWGGDIAGGLKAFVVGLVWSIPAGIFNYVLNLGDNWLLSLVAWIGGLVWSAITASALCDLAVSGNIADAFSRRAVDRVLQNLNIWAIVIVMSFVFSLLALVGLIGFIVGVLFTLAIALTAQMHLTGQAYRASEGRGTVPSPRF